MLICIIVHSWKNTVFKPWFLRNNTKRIDLHWLTAILTYVGVRIVPSLFKDLWDKWILEPRRNISSNRELVLVEFFKSIFKIKIVLSNGLILNFQIKRKLRMILINSFQFLNLGISFKILMIQKPLVISFKFSFNSVICTNMGNFSKSTSIGVDYCSLELSRGHVCE